MYFKSLATAAVAASMLLTGCANTQIANEELLTQQAKELASSATMTPEQALVSAADKVNKANEDKLYFYAPLHLEAAKDALSDAQHALSKGEPAAIVLEQAFKVESRINAGYKNKLVVQRSLAQSLEHKEVLEQLEVPDVLPDDFQKAVDKIQDLVQEIEGGFLDKALAGQPDVLEYMTKVEVKALKKIYLVPAESMLDKADSADADKYAEKTYEQAEQVLKSANLFVEKNYRDRSGVKQAGLDALNAASHAYYVALEAEKLVALSPEESEQRVLHFESLLTRVNTILAVENLSTMSLYDQSVAMAAQAEQLQRAAAEKKAFSIALPHTAPPLTIEAEAVVEPVVESVVEYQGALTAERVVSDAPGVVSAESAVGATVDAEADNLEAIMPAAEAEPASAPEAEEAASIPASQVPADAEVPDNALVTPEELDLLEESAEARALREEAMIGNDAVSGPGAAEMGDEDVVTKPAE